MKELAQAVLQYTSRQEGMSPFKTAIEGLYVLRTDHPKPPSHIMFRPAMCIVAQGAKWAAFGENRLQYRAGEALIVGVATPSVGRVIEARPGLPCLVLVLELDLAIIRSVAEGMDPPPKPSPEMGRGVFVTNFQGALSDCALRLVRLLDTPHAIPTLYPVIMREICYWLLTGPHGGEIARMTRANTPSHNLLSAIRALRDRFAETVRVEELAAIAQMSTSALHRHFKALTSMTPLQYQKQLRLLEARRLLISNAMSVQAAAFQVGYESASQFTREYSRMFGVPPKRDLKQSQDAVKEEPTHSTSESIPAVA